ncbi:MAG: signal transduction histidine kinase [Saprospiraceae bacterium]|jgi:signal transduction histidine kinase
MEEAYLEKAFMPFQRINNLERPGSGIGLAICKKVVNQHGGKIWYSSKRGEGITFCFTLNKQF